MAQRADTRGCAYIIIVLIVFGAIASLYEKMTTHLGLVLVLLMLAIIGFYLWIRFQQMKEEERKATAQKAWEERYAHLMSKYKNHDAAQNIMSRNLWQGMTADQVKDSIGNPAVIDQEVMKTKRRDTWKYYPEGANRYGLKLVLENDVLVGWDKKG